MKERNTVSAKLSLTAGLMAIILTCLNMIFLLLTFSGRLRFRYLYPHLKTITVVVISISFVLAVLAIIFGIILKRRGEGNLTGWAIWLGIIWMAFPIILGVGSYKIVQTFKEYKENPEGMTEEEQVVFQCLKNKEQLELIANEFWRKDNPDATKDDIKNLDLGPEGDLLGVKKGGRFIYYTGELGIFNCPSDEDLSDVDYAVDKIDGDGTIHIKCIHNEWHNKER